MIDFIAFIKTIKGRVAALVIIFIFLLTLFSSTTYLVSKKLNKLLATEEVWGRLQLNTAFSKWSFTIRQAVLAENIAKNNIPDKEQREKIRAERLNSTKTFYIDLDSLGVKLENELAAESKAILDFENQAEKIYARMEAIQQSDPNASFAKDSIIKNIMNNELPAIVYNFYQKTKAVAQFIIDSRNATRKEINDTIKFLIALILIVSFISAVSIILIWQYINKSLIKSIKSLKNYWKKCH